MSSFDLQVTRRLERHIQTRLNEKRLAGVCAGVWLNGQPVYEVCLGQRDPENGVALTPDTLFRLASMTKPVTGTAVMQQVEKGLLELDAPLSRWLPRFEKMQVAVATPEGEILAVRPAQQPITLRMLLTHSSGLGSGPAGDIQFNRLQQQFSGPVNLEKAVDAYADFVLDFQPGTTQLYSPVMAMDVLARLVELTSDEPYADYVKKNIFEPLEMPDTTYAPTPAQQARVMKLVDAQNGSLLPVDVADDCGFTGLPEGFTSGGAGLFSTLEDYSRFARMLLNNGEFNGQRILKKETVDAMATPQLPEDFWGITRYFNWGLSMRVCPEQKAPGQPLTPGSFGWSGAYGTHFWVDRTKNLTAVYLSNLADGGGSGAPTAFEFERDVMAGFGECE